MEKDLIIIGGGPGGYVAAIRAAQLGIKVTLIERDKIGGTCLNYGCVPTKALNRNAEVLNLLAQSEDFGIAIEKYSFDIEKIQRRKAEIVEQLVKGIQDLLSVNGVEVIQGNVEFIAPYEIKVMTEEGTSIQLSAKKIMIATGSTAQLPPIKGIEEDGVYTSKEMLEFREVPKKLAIIGGGVIGMEFACIFQALGSEVTVIEYEKSILPMLDADLSKRFTASLKKKGMKIHTATKVMEIQRNVKGLTLLAENKKGQVEVEADAVLVATGRKPVFEDLNLDQAGVAYTKQGIEVDEYFQTNVEGVYAIGDVNGKIMLAHAASQQGITAVEHMMGIDNGVNHDLVPNCIFVFPEIAAVGITETIAKKKNIDYRASKFQFAANAKALAMGEDEGFVKVICDPENVILGMQIMGAHASDIIHEGALAINQGLKVEDIVHTIHAHPTLSEAFVEASLGIKGEAIHMAPPRKTK